MQSFDVVDSVGERCWLEYHSALESQRSIRRRLGRGAGWRSQRRTIDAGVAFQARPGLRNTAHQDADSGPAGWRKAGPAGWGRSGPPGSGDLPGPVRPGSGDLIRFGPPGSGAWPSRIGAGYVGLGHSEIGPGCLLCFFLYPLPYYSLFYLS